MVPNGAIIYFRYDAKRGGILCRHTLKSQRKSKHKHDLSDRPCPKHYHMSHNYYSFVGNMSILSVEVIGIECQTDMDIFFFGGGGGVGVIKVHLKQNRTQKASIKSFILFSRCKIHNDGITIVGGL